MKRQRGWRRRVSRSGLIGLLLAGAALAGCNGDATPNQRATPLPEALRNRTPVIGVNRCQDTVDSDRVLEDGSEIMHETFTCRLVMSDPRASGREVWRIETRFLDSEDMTPRWTGEGTLTNEDGSWSGTGEGIVDLESSAYNQGQQIYMGHGGFEGLTLHVLISGSNTDSSYAGWIEGYK